MYTPKQPTNKQGLYTKKILQQVKFATVGEGNHTPSSLPHSLAILISSSEIET